MAETVKRVMDMVEKELRLDPGITTEKLFEKAMKLSPKVATLDSRQFNARYPLQIKRRQALQNRPAEASARGARRRSAAATREAVRGVVLEFAKELAAAETRSDVVAVISNVESYVERIMQAAGRS